MSRVLTFQLMILVYPFHVPTDSVIPLDQILSNVYVCLIIPEFSVIQVRHVVVFCNYEGILNLSMFITSFAYYNVSLYELPYKNKYLLLFMLFLLLLLLLLLSLSLSSLLLLLLLL